MAPGGAGDPEPASLGETLRAAREAKRFSVSDLNRTTRIIPRYIEAIEEDRFTDLPPPPYAQMFLSAYAKGVGLPAHEILERYCGVTGELPAHQQKIWEESSEQAPAPRARPFPWILVVVVVLLLVAIAFIARRG